jgi:hypothetical protein
MGVLKFDHPFFFFSSYKTKGGANMQVANFLSLNVYTKHSVTSSLLSLKPLIFTKLSSGYIREHVL